ncbi:MAG: ATP-binding protein [Bacteroidota bacterium]
MTPNLKILVLEDNGADADLLQRELKKSGLVFTCEIVQTREAFESSLKNFAPDIILSDYSLPSFDAVAAFAIKQDMAPDIPFIIVSGIIGEENAVDLIKSGVTDYASKDKLFTLIPKINRALKDTEEREEKKLIGEKLRVQTAELISANKELVFQNEENKKRATELSIAYEKLQKADEDLKMQAVIRLSEKSFRQLADLMPQMVWTAKVDGMIDYFNKQWFEYTGFKDVHAGQDWMPVLHADDVVPWQETFNRSIKTGKPYQEEFRFKDQKTPGAHRWFLCRSLPVQDIDGNITRWIGTCTDINDAKSIQEELEQTEQRRADFIKMVSHELKTPVTSIKGYVQLLMMILKEEKIELFRSDINNSLFRIDHQVSRLTGLITEMLDLSRIEAGKLELKNELFNLTELVNEAVEDITHTNPKHTVNLYPEFPCNIYGDRGKIEQVVINIVTNAIKYSANGDKIDIWIRKANDNMVEVSIKDYGIGIDKEEHKKIFERFYRVNGKLEETYAGFGIGLFLANEIIERHNGSINIESEKGKGAVFTFTLPIAS